MSSSLDGLSVFFVWFTYCETLLTRYLVRYLRYLLAWGLMLSHYTDY